MGMKASWVSGTGAGRHRVRCRHGNRAAEIVSFKDRPLPSWFVVLASVVLVIGCSKPRYPISGRVVFGNGDSYSGGGTVVFESGEGQERIMALAVIQPDGAFQTAREYKGLPAGECQARLVAPSPDLPDEAPDPDARFQQKPSRVPPPKPLPFDKRFLAFETSGLVFTVGPDLGSITIDLGSRP